MAKPQLHRLQGWGAKGRLRRKCWRILAAVFKIPIGRLVRGRLRKDSYIPI